MGKGAELPFSKGIRQMTNKQIEKWLTSLENCKSQWGRDNTSHSQVRLQ